MFPERIVDTERLTAWSSNMKSQVWKVRKLTLKSSFCHLLDWAVKVILTEGQAGLLALCLTLHFLWQTKPPSDDYWKCHKLQERFLCGSTEAQLFPGLCEYHGECFYRTAHIFRTNMCQSWDLNSKLLTPRLVLRPAGPAATQMFALVEWAEQQRERKSRACEITWLCHQLQICGPGAWCFHQWSMNKKKTISGHCKKYIDERMEMWKKYTVECLIKQVFSRLSNDKARGSFQKLGTLDPGVSLLTGEKLRPFFKGEFLWGTVWKHLCFIYSFQHGWILAKRAETFFFPGSYYSLIHCKSNQGCH